MPDLRRETWTIEDDEGIERDVEVEIDMSWLVSQMGRTAWRNKTKRTSACAGAIKVRRATGEGGRGMRDAADPTNAERSAASPSGA